MDAPQITAHERKLIAAKAQLNDAYLYQCITGRADLDATKAVRVERLSEKRIRRWHLRRNWFDTWPELIGTDGAPAVPAEAAGAS